jgi:hypothetical protein
VLEIRIEKQHTRKQIQAFGDKISKLLKQNGVKGSMSIALPFDIGPRSGYFTEFGDDIELFDPNMYYDGLHINKQDTFKSFSIFMIESNITQFVGTTDDKYNDCFYNCLKSIMNDAIPWATPEAFKKFLNVRRFDKVNIIENIPKVEKKLINFAINVTGDYIYKSSLVSNKIINLNVMSGHCSLAKMPEFDKVNKTNISNVERKPIMFNTITFMAYDGEDEYLMTREEQNKHNYKNSQYIIINKSKNKNLTLKEEYDEFIINANILKKESNNIINLFKTGNDKATALNLFDRFTKTILNPPNILQVEANFVSKATQGAIIFTEKYSGPAWKYDVKSMYPSIMNSGMLFPIKEGEFINLSTNDFIEMMEKGYFRYGLYKVNVKNNGCKLFRLNKIITIRILT